MKTLREKFERELINKLDQRISYNQSEEKYLLNALKYHDLKNTKMCDFALFQKFCTKVGIQVYNVEELRTIFDSYDFGHEGSLHHKILVARILGRPEPDSLTTTVGQSHAYGSPGKFSQPPKAIDPAAVEKLLDILAYKLNKQGFSSILNLTAELVESDKSGDSQISLSDFQKIIQNVGIDMSDEDIESIFYYLEVPGLRGRMDYGLLIKDLTAGFNNFRTGIVRSTFDRLDYQDTGKFDIRMLKELFNPRNHFDVKTGRKTTEEVIQEFYQALNAFVRTQRGQGNVNSQEFLDFWKQVSPNIENDFSFESLLKNCFRYNELPRQNKLSAPHARTNEQIEAPIYDKERYHPQDSIKYTMFPSSDQNVSDGYIYNIFAHLKKQIGKKGPKGFINLYRSFKCNDFDGDGKLSCKEFIKSLHEIRVELLDKETINVFKTFDTKNTGFISIPEFMSAFIPELSQQRQALVDELLNNLQSPNGRITYSTIKKIFYPRGHPDFLSGKTPDYQIKDEFFEILKTFLSLSGGVNDFIPTELLLQFFEIFSYAYDDDRFFEMIIKGSFRLSKLAYPVVDYSQTYSQYDAHSVHSSQVSNPPYGVHHNTYNQQKEFESPQSSANKKSDMDQDAPPSPDPTPPQQNFEKRAAPNNVITHEPPQQPIRNNFIQQSPSQASNIYERESRQQAPLSPPDVRDDGGSPSVQVVISKIKSQISSNPRGFFGLERLFVLADVTKQRMVDLEGLSDTLTQYEIDISNNDLRMIFNYLSEDNGKTVNYLQFISEVRGQMTQERENAVSNIFNRLDYNKTEQINTDSVIGLFKPENHPDVIRKHATADSIYDDFVDKFDLFGRLGGYDFQNGIIGFDEFLEFFDGLSALEPSDDLFFSFLDGCFA